MVSNGAEFSSFYGKPQASVFWQFAYACGSPLNE